MCWFIFEKYLYQKFGYCVGCIIPLTKSNAINSNIMATAKKAPQSLTVADLQALKPGTHIKINVAGATIQARILAVQPSGRFQARIAARLGWYDFTMFAGIVADVPAPAPVVVEPAKRVWFTAMPNELALFVDNCSRDDNAAPTIELAVNEANYILSLFAESGTSQSEALQSSSAEDRKWATSERAAIKSWLKKYGSDVTPVAPEVIPAPVAEPAQLAGKVSEFGAQILAGIRTLEIATHDENVVSASLAEYMGESPKRVAAGFVALLKVDAIKQGGEKGARTVSLTPLGNEYLNSVGPVAEPAPFALTDAQFAALSLLTWGMAAITDLFVADALREVDEAQPLWLNLVPSNTPGAYYDAELAPVGRAELMGDYPVLFAVPNATPEPVAEPTADATVPTANKRGPKNGVSVSAAGERKIADGATAVRLRSAGASKGGRPAKGNKSLRELVLLEVRAIIKKNPVATPKEAHKLIAAKLAMKPTQVQNAFFKLAASGFLAIKEDGKVANPLALASRAKDGYKTNHGHKIRVDIEAAIKTGASDAAIARQIGCDVAWVHDVRVGRVYQTRNPNIEQ